MRAVFDTVIYLRGLINRDGPSTRLLFQLCDRYTAVTSPAIMREILDVLYRSRIRNDYPHINELGVDRVLAIFEKSEVVEPTEHFRASRDLSDDKLFDCAAAGDAAYVVSEDFDVLSVGDFRGIRTVNANQFTELIRASEG